MARSFWINYLIPGDTDHRHIPVSDYGDGFVFDDGAYDAYDYFWDKEANEIHPDAGEWEDIVRGIVAPLLADAPYMTAHSMVINGKTWSFVRDTDQEA